MRNMLERGRVQENKGRGSAEKWEERWEERERGGEREREIQRKKRRRRGRSAQGLGVPGWGFCSSVVGPSRLSCLFVGIKELPLTPPANWCNEWVSYMFFFFSPCAEEFKYLLDKIFCNCSSFIDRSNMLNLAPADSPIASWGGTALIKRANLPSANVILYLRKFEMSIFLP